MSPACLPAFAETLADLFLEAGGDLSDRLAVLEADAPPTLAPLLARLRASRLDPDAQATEYARLFLHNREGEVVHLFGSVQAHGHLMAPDVLQALRELHQAADLSLQEGLKVPPDHLGLELACLATLLRQMEEGPEAQARYRPLALRLLREHLAPLTGAVAAQLPGIQAQPYFLAAGELARDLVAVVEKALA